MWGVAVCDCARLCVVVRLVVWLRVRVHVVVRVGMCGLCVWWCVGVCMLLFVCVCGRWLGSVCSVVGGWTD